MPYRRRYSRSRPRRVSRARRSLKSRRYGGRLQRRVRTLERQTGKKLTYFVAPLETFRVDGDSSANAVYIKSLSDYSTWVSLFPGNTGLDDDCYSMYHRGLTLKGNLRWTPEEGASLSQSLNMIIHVFIVSPLLYWNGTSMTNGLHYRASDDNAIVYMNLKYFRVHAHQKVLMNGYEPAYQQRSFLLRAKGVGNIYSPDQPLKLLTSSGDPKDNLYAIFFSNIVGGTSTERPNLDCQMEGLNKVYTHYSGAGYT